MKKIICLFLLAAMLLQGCSKEVSVTVDTREVTSSEEFEVPGVSFDIGSDTEPAESVTQTEAGVTEPETTAAGSHGERAVFRFAGDFTQAELGGIGVTMSIMNELDTTFGGDITKCFSDDLLALMQDADIFMLNNEFVYSEGGSPTDGKDWTFKANPDRVGNLKKLGVDCVGLANNHMYDWGAEALIDTLNVLDGADIRHCGAGRNIDEAKKPIYLEVKGKRFSIVAATTVEYDWEPEYGMTRGATEASAGVLRADDPSEMLDAIRIAKENSDFCFVFIHWGVEMKEYPEKSQRKLAKKIVEAGADAIVGMHPHILQGMEFVEGVPVIYSLGNYWFNSKTRQTCLYEVSVDTETLEPEVRFYPCLQSECRTVLITKEESRRKALEEEEELSKKVEISSDGYVYDEKKNDDDDEYEY